MIIINTSMNEHIPSAHEPSPNEMAAKVDGIENRLNVLRAERERLTLAIQQFPEPGLGFSDDLKKVSNEIAELEGQLRGETNGIPQGYYDEKNKQMELDLEPEK